MVVDVDVATLSSLSAALDSVWFQKHQDLDTHDVKCNTLTKAKTTVYMTLYLIPP